MKRSSSVYNPELLPQATIQWVMAQALNELHGYLCDIDARNEDGQEWAQVARTYANLCRSVADAATQAAEKGAWLRLAADYEDTI
jgi:hypothetical protein